MKKLLFLALALLLVLTACAKEETPAPTQPTETTTTEAEEATAPVSGTIPTETTTQAQVPGLDYDPAVSDYTHYAADGETALITVRANGRPIVEALPAVTEYYTQWLSDFQYNASLLEDQAEIQLDWAKSNNQVFIPYASSVDFEVMRNDGLIFSVLRASEEYTGGVHEMVQYSAESFVVESQALLTAADLFSVPLEEAMATVFRLVAAQMQADTLDALYSGDAETALRDAWDSRSFVLTDTGILFFWQVYDIAPYPAGPQLYEIPYAELSGILNTQWLPL